MTENPAIRPSRWLYLIGAALMLIGISVFFVQLFHGIFHITDNLTQIIVPGNAEMTLQENTTYTMFLERRSIVNGRVFITEGTLPSLTCSVNSQGTGNKIEVDRPNGSTTYDVGRRSGRAILEFDTEETGIYRIACAYAGGSATPQVVIAVGAGVEKAIGMIVLKCVVTMFGFGGAGSTILVVIFLMRERAKRRLMPLSQTPL